MALQGTRTKVERWIHARTCAVRVTNAFSKKIENMMHAVALNFTFYNYCRIHKTLRVTPAMDAGLTDHVWELEELMAILG
jgi:hypothetical protein